MPAAKTRKVAKKKPRSVLDGFPVKAALVVVGVVGLTALGILLFGPRRFRDEIVGPLRAVTYTPLAAAVAPQAERVWDETRRWRDRVGRILESVNTDEVREMVGERLKQWVERLR